jgi:hypothetical protein
MTFLQRSFDGTGEGAGSSFTEAAVENDLAVLGKMVAICSSIEQSDGGATGD